ncbi:WD40 repeat domain-containing protein [Candidatus Falkowbacteria bacterium]|jgi:WD40 repeat protein|nr:WD40 repeat domain-containing protein [Candidatus Falkowbacteria bacterium]MBT5503009.1 WD40 repeat domain-containing protein [Candidatus Falkowbacteria bacterium]MBT6574365.1 WD40 repeat domain-containing protein [Candidatus Falkowbacteria bacterium]MBT7349042.1 WD40 repeat domain-containing protein [Candidatus Falkowbacteria bacterium]MBT7500964.1 WD40 repeat domain-containing protein [Candidatus Falkowbacteria bacterium]
MINPEVQQLSEKALKVNFNEIQQAHFDRLMSELEAISDGLGFAELKAKAEAGSKEALQVMRDYITKKEQIVKFIETKEISRVNWELESEPVLELPVESIEACDISPDGSRLIYITESPTSQGVYVKYLQNNKPPKEIFARTANIAKMKDVKFVPDGEKAFIVTNKPELYTAWLPTDVKEGDWVQERVRLAHAKMHDCAVSPNGQDILFVGDGYVEIANLENIHDPNRTRLVLNLKHEDPDRAEGYIQAGVCFSPDGKIAYVPLNEKICRIDLNKNDNPIGLPTWESDDVGESITQFDPIYSVAITSDGEYLFTGTQDGQISKWETATGKEMALTVMEENDGDINSLTTAIQKMIVSPDNKHLIVGDDFGRLTFIDIETGEHIKEIQLPQASSVTELKLVGEDTIYAQTETMIHRVKSI